MSSSKDLLKLEHSSTDTFIEGLLKRKDDESEEQKTFRPPPSSVLSRVKDFLPEMERANDQLVAMVENNMQDKIDIENTDDTDGPVIEMNLALFQVEDDDSGISSSDTDSSDSSDDSAIIIEKGLSADSIKLSNNDNTKKPVIVDLCSSDSHSDTNHSSELESS